jgi:hypothetical protein
MKTSFVLSLLVLGPAGNSAIALAQSPSTFSATGGMTTPRLWHTATLLTNGKVLIAGGSVGFDAPAATAELYDPDSGIFTLTGDMTTPRYGHTATLLPDGRVLIAGGTIRAGQGFIPSNTAEIHDPSTGTFAATGNLVSEHVCQQANLLGSGKVLIIGGNGLDGRVPDAELYDPATGTFAATGTYASDTSGFNTCQGAVSTLLPDGRVLIVWEENAAELYDPNAGAFSPTGSNLVQDYNDGLPTATLLMNGKVLVAGGSNDGRIYNTGAELYGPSTGTFIVTGNMTTGRTFDTTTLLPDGHVLMAGAFLFPGALASAELYDPATGSFTATSNMTTARGEGHTATLLNNGRVLIAGGDYTSPLSSFAELYTPSVLVPAPALFSLSGDGRGQGAIWDAATGQVVSPGVPAVAGEVLAMYTTSLGDGSVIPPQVAIGGRLGEILYFGGAPGYPGYYQINFRVPSGVTPGTAVPVRLTYIGRTSNEVTIGVTGQ